MCSPAFLLSPVTGTRGICFVNNYIHPIKLLRIPVRIFRLGTSCSAFSDFSNDVSPDVAPGQNKTFHMPHGDGLAQVFHLFPQTFEILSYFDDLYNIASCVKL